MMEKYSYASAAHHVVKLLATESFPMSRTYLMTKYANVPIQVDFNGSVAFSELLDKMKMENYETAVAFYAELNAIL